MSFCNIIANKIAKKKVFSDFWIIKQLDTHKRILKSKQLRTTQFRLDVLSLFVEHKTALSIHQIEEYLEEFDRITLYRTIKSFTEKGLIHEIQLDGNLKKYAMCADQCTHEGHVHQHVHFHCTSCEETYCLDWQQQPLPMHQDGFQVSNYDIRVNGTCRSCGSLAS